MASGRLSACFLDAVTPDELVYVGHDQNVRERLRPRQLGLWWRELFEGVLEIILVCATIVQGVTAIRATRVQGGATKVQVGIVSESG